MKSVYQCDNCDTVFITDRHMRLNCPICNCDKIVRI